MSGARQRKPLDVGDGSLRASFAIDGNWLAIGSLHPDIGLVEVVGVPALTPGDHGDPDAVRLHRTWLTDPAYAVLRFPSVTGAWDCSRALWSLSGPGWQSTVTAWPARDGTVVQRHNIRPTEPGKLRIRCTGRLDRPEYAMITPVGPVPPRLPATRVSARGPMLTLTVPHRQLSATITVRAPSHNAAAGDWVPDGAAMVLDTCWDRSAEEVQVDVVVAVHGDRVPAATTGGASGVAHPAERSHRSDALAGLPTLEKISAGARRYTRDCTAISTREERCCIVTDHRLLPLSWTRDGYYQAALLLASGEQQEVDVVGKHLAWLWAPGRDRNGVWQRSHFVNGAVKDGVYQADQQLYPLLELADYRRVLEQWPPLPGPGAGWGALVRDVWERLPRAFGELVHAAENPADDLAGLPYLLSNQLLLAYVARRLAQWEVELGIQDLQLDADADKVLTLLRTTHSCVGPRGLQWAYDADAEGQTRLYHDANDVPTALAPLWGLCAPDDAAWTATMRSAWSTDNPGYVAGAHGGLGSRHTPGVWPLGDAQELAVAHLTGDVDRERQVITKLQLVASADGMLPETYHPDTGDWVARHWFAWPGSLIGLLDATLHQQTGPWLGA